MGNGRVNSGILLLLYHTYPGLYRGRDGRKRGGAGDGGSERGGTRNGRSERRGGGSEIRGGRDGGSGRDGGGGRGLAFLQYDHMYH